MGDVLFYVKNWLKLTNPFKNINFKSIFICSAYAITSSEMSVHPSVRVSKFVLCDKTKKLLPTFLYHMKGFSDKKNGWWETTPCT